VEGNANPVASQLLTLVPHGRHPYTPPVVAPAEGSNLLTLVPSKSDT